MARKARKTSSASVERWEREADIPLDAEEEFHASRDRILLEGESDADDDFADDDEVFALRGVGASSDSEPEPDAEDAPAPAKAKAKKDKKKTKKKKNESEDESDEEGWGRKKSAYYADDDVASDDDDAQQLQEAEARRVQAKARADLTDDDFGLADLRIADEPADEQPAAAVAQGLPTDKDGLTRHLARHSPETLALAREWDDTAHALLKATRAVEKAQAANPDALSLGLLHVHHQTLQTYATTLAFYFHLRAAGTPRLREHPILQRLLVLKQALATLEDLDFGGDSDSDDGSDEDGLSADSDDDDAGWKALELADLLRDSARHDDVPRRRVKGLAAQPLAAIPEEPPQKKKNKARKLDFDLVEPAFVSSKTKKGTTVAAAADEFGDPAALQAADAADKRARKRSLKFHAARIDAGAARREGARAARMGGDEDVPYPERRKEAEKRRAEELARRRHKLGGGGDDLDDAEPAPPETKKRRRDAEGSGEEEDAEADDGYYELVSRGRKEAKKAKREAYEAERAAERVVDDEDETEGPRALTRAILSNKGLTPHRSKSVRNPRVKKRLRYEKAKKKVASQKAVFKSGATGSGGVYEGEKSGISRNVVKSTRLG